MRCCASRCWGICVSSRSWMSCGIKVGLLSVCYFLGGWIYCDVNSVVMYAFFVYYMCILWFVLVVCDCVVAGSLLIWCFMVLDWLYSCVALGICWFV